VHADGYLAELFRHVLDDPWFVSADVTHYPVTQLFCFPPFGGTPTEHRDQTAVRLVV
jgi:hypothetical protein